MMTVWLHYPLVQGALSGILSAALVDYSAFRAWKTWGDVKGYHWGVASFRWFQGGIAGLIAAAGLSLT